MKILPIQNLNIYRYKKTNNNTSFLALKNDKQDTFTKSNNTFLWNFDDLKSNKIFENENFKKLDRLCFLNKDYLKTKFNKINIQNTKQFEEFINTKTFSELINDEEMFDIEVYDIISLAQTISSMKEKQFKKAMEFINTVDLKEYKNNQISSSLKYFLNNMSQLDDEQYKNIVSYYKKGLKTSQLGFLTRYENNKKILELISKGFQSGQNISEIIEEYDEEEYQQLITLLFYGFDEESAMLIVENGDFDNILSICGENFFSYSIEKTSPKEYFLTRLNRDKKGDVLFISNENAKKNEDIEFLNPNEQIVKTKNKTFYLKYKNENSKLIEPESVILLGSDDLIETIEIKKENGKIQAFHKKLSDILQGAFIVEKYTLEEKEDKKIIDEILEGKIKPDEILSEVKKDENGNIEFNQNFDFTKRKYIKGKDFIKYQYLIEDEKQKLNLNRYWKKNSNNSTTTIVNNKKYIAQFFDETKTAKIIDDENNVINIDFNNIINKNKNTKNIFKLWQMIKNAPADLLNIIANNVSEISFSYLKTYGEMNMQGDILKTSDEISVLAHELGHSRDYFNHRLGVKNISSDLKLKEIYDEEWEKFKKNYPFYYRKNVEYFTPDGWENKKHLEELTAEANMLMITPFNIFPVMARSEILIEHFPKSIARIAKLLGY